MYELEKQRQMKVRNAIRKRWLGMQEDSWILQSETFNKLR
jgi:hypothetical protein